MKKYYILVKAWFVILKILLFSGKNEHQLLQSAWGMAQKVRLTAMRSALYAIVLQAKSLFFLQRNLQTFLTANYANYPNYFFAFN